MKKARFTDEQIVRILQEADRDPIAAVAKRHGVGEPSIYGAQFKGERLLDWSAKFALNGSVKTSGVIPLVKL